MNPRMNPKMRNFKRPINEPKTTNEQNVLKIIPLGGLEEIGKNMTAFEYGNDIIVVDAGLMFPQEEMLGIDFVIPDTTYLQQNKNKIRGMLITHGHEDHIGAIPYILPKLSPPIYTTKLTKGLIDVKLEEFKTTKPKFNVIGPGDRIKLGCFDIEFFHVNHSIPDGLGIAISTPVGLIVHTGDFKFDHTPARGEEVADFDRLASYGQKGTLLLMCDSTNAEVEGYTPSEKVIGERFDEIFENAENRIIITSFASLINRIQQVFNSAQKYNRKVALAGRSMVANVDIALKLGYLTFPKGLLVNIREINKIPDNKLAIMCTGSQGEELSALARMSSGDHKQVKIKKGDTIVISASPIPGNERAVSNTINNLFKEGANVIYGRKMDIHVSGHASQEDLKMMMNLVKPKYFMPIHGEFRHLVLNGRLAESVGIPASNILIAENGQIVEAVKDRVRVSDRKVSANYIMIDGLGVGDVGNIVLRDRHMMASDGIFVVILTIDGRSGKVLTSPDIISRGFVYMREAEDLINKTRQEAIRALEQERNTSYPADWTFIKNKIRDDIGEFLYKNTKRRPMVIPVIIEV